MLETVEIFPWNANFETGIPEIDSQHRRLVDLLNRLVTHLAFRAEAPALNAVFEELKAYTLIHFCDEEAIWAAELGDADWAPAHARSHAGFVEEVLRLKAEENVKPLDDVIEDIVGFLTHWLALHIIDADKRLAKAVFARREGLSIEDAKRRADDEMAGATRALIGTVMSMYDRLATRTVQLTREMTRRRQAEEQLQRANAQLEAAREAAVAANEAKSMYLANMSHEIRTPINAISGMATLMQRESVSPEQAENLQTIEDAAHHLLRIVDDILDLSKIEAGKLSLESLPLGVDALLESVVAMLGARAASQGLALKREPSDIAVQLAGDPTRLRQALLNFVGNALKFTEAGSVTLRARCVDETREGMLVRFEVEDTGIGISSEALPRLFANFEQTDPAISRKYGGTGLGLAITRKLARLMGGDAGVESRPGEGSTFWFTARLARSSGSPVATDVTQVLAEERLKRDHAETRVLLVEDNVVNRRIARALLSSVGLQVDSAGDGREALEMTGQAAYALIVMDMRMPVMDGLEATRRIRALPGYRSTPVLGLTASAVDADRADCLAAGMDDVLVKPVRPEALFATLLGLLESSPAG